MAITVDVANLGTANSDSSGSTWAFTTTSAVAAGGFIVVSVGYFGSTATVTGVSGGSLSWTVDYQSNPPTAGAARDMAIASAQAPSGLASSTTITASFSDGTPSARTMGGMSLLGVATSSPLDGTPVGPTDSVVAAWATASYTIAAGSILVATCWNENTASGNTATSPSVEAWDLAAGGGYGHVMQYRIESSGGSYTSAGTWGAAQPSTNIAVAYKVAGAATTYTLAPHNVTPLTWRT